MTIKAFFRLLPFAFVLVGAGSWAMSAGVRPVGADTAATTMDHDIITAVKGIPPYGAMRSGITPVSETIAPYGAFGGDTMVTPVRVLPYGAMSHDTLTASATVLPYGAMRSR